jgi:4-diphosphocytidyl-2-C-methyl-D-erythritol kinase
VRRGPAPRARGIRLRAFAKLNLGLEVLGARQDGYHELRTLFQTIDLHDELTLAPRPAGISVRCDHPGVPLDERNLAHRAAVELARFAGVARGVEIRIRKRIPVAGGLGGGSSDAAATLLALDRLWGLGLGPAGLQGLARRLGADVPYFLVGGTALGLARGDEVYPLHGQLSAHYVVVVAGPGVSTAAVFRRLDARLTPRENSNMIFRFVSRHLEGEGGFPLLANELEQAALDELPALAEPIRRIRGILGREGALLASLSGSGSCFFGLFDGPLKAKRAQASLGAAGFVAMRGRTLSLDGYRRTLRRSLR